jgi:hypothetical protein
MNSFRPTKIKYRSSFMAIFVFLLLLMPLTFTDWVIGQGASAVAMAIMLNN